MAHPTPSRPTDGELSILRILWQHGGRTAAEIRDELGKAADVSSGSIQVRLQIMLDKGYVRRDERKRPHVYFARVTEEGTKRRLLRDFIDRLFGVFPYGQAISRTTYATAFSLFGTTFGSGDGSTTFNVPDVRGRNRAVVDDLGGTTANRLAAGALSAVRHTLGGAGGADTNTIAQANLPSVNLTTTISAGQGSHSHTTPATYDSAQGGLTNGTGSVQYNVGAITTATATLPAMSGTTPLGGSGTALNNVQPTILCNYILRIV